MTRVVYSDAVLAELAGSPRNPILSFGRVTAMSECCLENATGPTFVHTGALPNLEVPVTPPRATPQHQRLVATTQEPRASIGAPAHRRLAAAPPASSRCRAVTSPRSPRPALSISRAERPSSRRRAERPTWRCQVDAYVYKQHDIIMISVQQWVQKCCRKFGRTHGGWRSRASLESRRPPYPKITLCRNPPAPVKKFTAPPAQEREGRREGRGKGAWGGEVDRVLVGWPVFGSVKCRSTPPPPKPPTN